MSMPVTKEHSISRELERGFRKQKLDLQILRSARKTMEDVFVTVVEEQEGQKS